MANMPILRCFSMTVTLLFPFLAGAQVRPQFEVVSIKPALSLPQGANLGLNGDVSQVRMPWVSLKDLALRAFRVKRYQIFGPTWLGEDHFEIVAKIPDGFNQQNVPEMLQGMLQDRFEMKSHWEKKEIPVYTLGLSKPVPNLKEVAAPETQLSLPNANIARGSTIIDFGGGSTLSFSDNMVDAKKVTLDDFVQFFSNFLDRPVINSTGLKGHYDFKWSLSPGDFQTVFIWAVIAGGGAVPSQAVPTGDASSLDSLANALKDAGLKLERAKAPIDALVIDSVLKKPTDN